MPGAIARPVPGHERGRGASLLHIGAVRVDRDFLDLADSVRARARASIRCGDFTERGLARAAGMSQSHMSNWLARRRRLSLELLGEVMRALRLSVSDL